MKILNWLFYTGLWTQPFSMYGLMQIMNKTLSELQKDTKTGLLFLFFSFLPTIYIWNQNKTAKKNGKRQFGMLDSMNHQLDPAYQTKFQRQVNKGEQGIRILAPAPYKVEKDVKKIDEKTGKEIIERQEVIVPAYKVATVFDISQTTGKELPQIVTPLEGDIKAYQNFMEAIKASSPVPIEIRNIAKESVNGYYSQTLKKIVVQEGMEEMQTIKTAIHELSHAILHDEETGTEGKLDTKTKEVQAESVAYTVC